MARIKKEGVRGFLGFLLLVLSVPVWALGLGSIEVQSYLGQPFRAVIPLHVDSPSDLDGLTVSLGTPAEFNDAGIEPSAADYELRFKVVSTSDHPVIEVTSAQPIREPFLNFLVRAQWNAGTLLRQYTVLVNPAEYAGSNTALVSSANSATTTGTTPEAASPATGPVTNAGGENPPTTGSFGKKAASAASRAVPIGAAKEVGRIKPGSRYGPVKVGESLWDIASRVRRDTSLSLDQVVLSIYNANPKAFVHRDFNKLMSGRTLQVPTVDAMRSVSKSAAREQVVALVKGITETAATGEGTKQVAESKGAAGKIAATSAATSVSAGAGGSPASAGSISAAGGPVSSATAPESAEGVSAAAPASSATNASLASAAAGGAAVAGNSPAVGGSVGSGEGLAASTTASGPSEVMSGAAPASSASTVSLIAPATAPEGKVVNHPAAEKAASLATGGSVSAPAAGASAGSPSPAAMSTASNIVSASKLGGVSTVVQGAGNVPTAASSAVAGPPPQVAVPASVAAGVSSAGTVAATTLISRTSIPPGGGNTTPQNPSSPTGSSSGAKASESKDLKSGSSGQSYATPEDVQKTPVRKTKSSSSANPGVSPPVKAGRLGEVIQWLREWRLQAIAILAVLILLMLLLRRRQAAYEGSGEDSVPAPSSPGDDTNPEHATGSDRTAEGNDTSDTATGAAQESNDSRETRNAESVSLHEESDVATAATRRDGEGDGEEAVEQIEILATDLQARDTANRRAEDALAEAELRMAYGLNEEAIQILSTDLKNNPDRIDVKEKLAECYAVAGNAAKFRELAEELHSRVTDVTWHRLSESGRKLCPDDPLFMDSSPGVSESAASGDQDFLSQVGSAEEVGASGDASGPASGTGKVQIPGDGTIDFDMEVVPSTSDRLPEHDAGEAFERESENAAEIDLSAFDQDADVPDATHKIDFQTEDDSPNSQPTGAVKTESAARVAEGNLVHGDVGDSSASGTRSEPGGEGAESETGRSYKLDLARAYADMGDNDAARDLVQEVLDEGAPLLQEEARRLLQDLAG